MNAEQQVWSLLCYQLQHTPKDEKTNCLSLLNSFLKSRKHIAVVKDEFDGLSGIVTLEDLIETALGHEIVDETDKIVDLQAEARKEVKNK